MAARKPELIEPHAGDKRFARRNNTGHILSEQVDVSRSLDHDNHQRSQLTVSKGQGIAASRTDAGASGL